MLSNQSTRKKAYKPDTEEQDYSVLYSALMSHYLHQDNLLWSRVQILIAVQGAILVAGFSLRGHWLSSAIMLLGALLTSLVMILVFLDQTVRDSNLAILDKLAEKFLPDRIKKELHQEGYEAKIRYTTPTKYKLMRGRYIFRGILIIFISIDILFAILYQWASCLFP